MYTYMHGTKMYTHIGASMDTQMYIYMDTCILS